MFGKYHSYYWYMTCFDSSSQTVLSFSLCFTGPWLSSVPGCHDAEAAVFFSIWGSTKDTTGHFSMRTGGTIRGSHVYEINTWLWNFGRPQPHIGGLSVVKTEETRKRSRSETSWRAWKTRQARKRAADEEEPSWSDMTFIYQSYTCHIWMLIKTWIRRDCVMPPA